MECKSSFQRQQWNANHPFKGSCKQHSLIRLWVFNKVADLQDVLQRLGTLLGLWVFCYNAVWDTHLAQVALVHVRKLLRSRMNGRL
eukprot:363107-Chlamydomonas_euryale.AAC.5